MLGVNTNINAAVTIDALRKNEQAMGTAMERLSTGLRINSAADDAAGMKVANRMTSQSRGLNQAVTNAQNAISMVETAEGGTQARAPIRQKERARLKEVRRARARTLPRVASSRAAGRRKEVKGTRKVKGSLEKEVKVAGVALRSASTDRNLGVAKVMASGASSQGSMEAMATTPADTRAIMLHCGCSRNAAKNRAHRWVTWRTS